MRCPFCGGEDLTNTQHVKCADCGAKWAVLQEGKKNVE